MVKPISKAEAMRLEGTNQLVGVLSISGEVSYFWASSMDAWKAFVKRTLGWY